MVTQYDIKLSWYNLTERFLEESKQLNNLINTSYSRDRIQIRVTLALWDISCRTFGAYHFVYIAEKKFYCSSLWLRLWMCTYIIFSACRYTAQTASVKFRIGSPKTARNEQVCAHHAENCREYEIWVRGYSR